MALHTQPILENDKVLLSPLQNDDFDALYAVASDPKVWEQHPNKDRWRNEVFQTFFESALQSKGAFKVIDKATGQVAGSTRMYDYRPEESSILIGYTFFGTAYWGKGFNPAVKTLLLDYLFGFVARVYFHIGAGNVRSQIAIGNIGARKVGEQEVTYYGELPKLNYIYCLEKEEWLARKGTRA